MLALAYGCGLRAGEVARLKAGDIDSAQGIIRVVQSKGRKDRHVMLPEEALELLRQWWKERPTRFDAGVPPQKRLVFPGRKAGKPLTTRQLNRLFHDHRLPPSSALASLARTAGSIASSTFRLRPLPRAISTTQARRRTAASVQDSAAAAVSSTLTGTKAVQAAGLRDIPGSLPARAFRSHP